jgi:hypothetical protein
LPVELVQAEEQHRDHAIIEQVFADWTDGPLAHLPSGIFPANAAWLACAAIAHNLLRAAGSLASLAYGKARGATIRRDLGGPGAGRAVGRPGPAHRHVPGGDPAGHHRQGGRRAVRPGRAGQLLADPAAGRVLGTALVQYTYPAGPDGQTAVEFAINPAMIREAFAADLPPETTALMAATQRPAAAAAFTDASGPPAWKKLPSWAVVATGDKAAGTDVVRAQARRAGADIIEVEGSHVIMISQPQAVTDHILKAVQAVAASPR